MPRPLRILSESEARPESFHDCHIHGLRWRRDRFSFSLDLQYILEWLTPDVASSGAYRFSVCEAQLVFHSVSELKLTMDWSGSALDAEIATLRVPDSRRTPSGQLDRRFEIELSEPDGVISLWSTGYELRLLGSPVISAVSSLPLPEE
jgi:hypothetical protein